MMEQSISCAQLVGHDIPWFERDSSHGHVTSRDESGNHPRLLVFCPSLDDTACRQYLESIISDQGEYETLQAMVLIITPGRKSKQGESLPFSVISNAKDLFQQFGMMGDDGQPRMGVAVVDRYGTVDSCYSGASAGDLPQENIVLTRLRSAESQCPECGVPEAQWANVEI